MRIHQLNVVDGTAYNDLATEEKEAFALTPNPQDQEWIAAHWLRSIPEQEDAINAAMPSNIQVEAMVDSEGRWLGSDLLTACHEGQSHYPARETIRALPIYAHVPEPPPPPDELA